MGARYLYSHAILKSRIFSRIFDPIYNTEILMNIKTFYILHSSLIIVNKCASTE